MNTTGGSERKVVKITEERMNEVLPPNILESELDLATKKVLAALCDWYLNSPAKESGIVIISNKELVAIACVGGTQLQKALRQLQDYNLVDRIIGTGLGNASQYRIDFKQMMKPLKRKTFAELFNLELEESESSEKLISTIVQYSIVQSSSDKSSSSYNSSDKSIEDKSIAEECIPEGTGLDGDLFGTKTYFKNGNTKNDIIKEDFNKELVRTFEEGVTEPNSMEENEGKENPNLSQNYSIITIGEFLDSTPTGVQTDKTCNISPVQSRPQPNEEKSLTESSCLPQPIGDRESLPQVNVPDSPERRLNPRAQMRQWALELEEKYKDSERPVEKVLQELACDSPELFGKYVRYLRTQRSEDYEEQKELVHDLATAWKIDID